MLGIYSIWIQVQSIKITISYYDNKYEKMAPKKRSHLLNLILLNGYTPIITEEDLIIAVTSEPTLKPVS